MSFGDGASRLRGLLVLVLITGKGSKGLGTDVALLPPLLLVSSKVISRLN